MRQKLHSAMQSSVSQPMAGFTLIELMIVVAIIAIILSLALPVYTDYTIRAKVGEAISVAAAAKTAITQTCMENPNIEEIDPDNTGYDFQASTYVASIDLDGPCTEPVIRLSTQNTGANPDPVITLTGFLGEGRMRYTCETSGLGIHVPRECRS